MTTNSEEICKCCSGTCVDCCTVESYCDVHEKFECFPVTQEFAESFDEFGVDQEILQRAAFDL